MAEPADPATLAGADRHPNGGGAASGRPCTRPLRLPSLASSRRSNFRVDIPSITTDGSRRVTMSPMARIRLFAAARDAAGTGRDELPGDTVGEVLTLARQRYGATFDAVLTTCRIWVNGEPAEVQDTIRATDELAVLPPVSGG